MNIIDIANKESSSTSIDGDVIGGDKNTINKEDSSTSIYGDVIGGDKNITYNNYCTCIWKSSNSSKMKSLENQLKLLEDYLFSLEGRKKILLMKKLNDEIGRDVYVLQYFISTLKLDPYESELLIKTQTKIINEYLIRLFADNPVNERDLARQEVWSNILRKPLSEEDKVITKNFINELMKIFIDLSEDEKIHLGVKSLFICKMLDICHMIVIS